MFGISDQKVHEKTLSQFLKPYFVIIYLNKKFGMLVWSQNFSEISHHKKIIQEMKHFKALIMKESRIKQTGLTGTY